MKSTDYIRRTLPHGLNWNILTQLFAEDGIEITNEIRAYLNTTPWNTNIKVLESLTGSGEDEEEGGGFPGEIILQQPITEYTPGWDDGEDWGYGEAKTAIDENVEKISVGDRIQIFIENNLWYEILVNSISSDDNGKWFKQNNVGNKYINKRIDQNFLLFKSSSSYNLPEANVGAIITVVKVENEK